MLQTASHAIYSASQLNVRIQACRRTLRGAKPEILEIIALKDYAYQGDLDEFSSENLHKCRKTLFVSRMRLLASCSEKDSQFRGTMMDGSRHNGVRSIKFFLFASVKLLLLLQIICPSLSLEMFC